MKVLYPYKTLVGDLELSVSAVAVDGVAIADEHIDADHRAVAISALDRHKWETASIRVEVTGPQTEILEFMAEGASPQVVAILHGGSTNTRKAVELRVDGSNPARFAGKVELERPNWWGRLVLSASIVGTVDGTAGRVIGAADPWVVSLDDVPRRPVTGNIPVVWENFQTSEALPALRRIADEPCYVHLDLDQPVFYLNESFPGLRPLFDERARRASEVQALHDQTRVMFAVETWNAMFGAALAAAADTADDEGLVNWPDAEWQKNVLEILLDRMYGDSSPLDALREVVELHGQGDGFASVNERLLIAISAQIGAARLLRGSISRLRDLDLTEGAT